MTEPCCSADEAEGSSGNSSEPSSLTRTFHHAGFLLLLLLNGVIDGIFLLGTYFWQVWMHKLMDPTGLEGSDAFFFGATRLALSTTPFVLVVVYVLNDLFGAVRRIWRRR